MSNDRAKIERDVWTASFEQRKRELIKEGMSPDEADDKASAEIRREIRGSK